MAIESHDAIPAIYETIKSWIKGLGESTDFTGNPEIEAASWYRNLTQDLRLRLDLDLDHWGEGNAINLKDGPLVEFFARYSRVIGLKSDHSPEDGRSDPAPRDIRGEEAVSINVELGRLEQADPVWFADWERFVGSIDDTDPDED